MSWLISGLDERLSAAARTDNEDLFQEIFNSKRTSLTSTEIVIDKDP